MFICRNHGHVLDLSRRDCHGQHRATLVWHFIQVKHFITMWHFTAVRHFIVMKCCEVTVICARPRG